MISTRDEQLSKLDEELRKRDEQLRKELRERDEQLRKDFQEMVPRNFSYKKAEICLNTYLIYQYNLHIEFTPIFNPSFSSKLLKISFIF